MLEEIKEMLKERELELNKDYQNVLSTINKLDRDRSNLVDRGVQLRGALEEIKSLKVRIDKKEQDMINNSNDKDQEIVGEDKISPEALNQ